MSHDRTPDIEELRAFCAAADLGGIGRAAVRLRISQPAVSKRLHNLEASVGVQLLERSPHGVKLTPAGRRLYDEAERVLQALDRVSEVVSGLVRSGGPVRLAASHSAADTLVSELLGRLGDSNLAVELVTANSSVVRDMVADGRVDLGVAASRPNHTPYPGVRERPLLTDEIVLAVADTHPWAARDEVSLREFLRTRLVVRDAGSNSRWTVEAVLRERGLVLAAPLVEAGTPQAAIREARARRAPVLLGRGVLRGHGFHELPVTDLSFPREFVMVLPAIGEPPKNVDALMELLARAARA
ncbi:MAG TPA: LysR family transcriptional regulator [Solirubrobacteraceae bacterium]